MPTNLAWPPEQGEESAVISPGMSTAWLVYYSPVNVFPIHPLTCYFIKLRQLDYIEKPWARFSKSSNRKLLVSIR
jgi:hypothetical protein